MDYSKLKSRKPKLKRNYLRPKSHVNYRYLNKVQKKQRLAARRKKLFEYKQLSKKLLEFFNSRDLDLSPDQSKDLQKMTEIIVAKFPGEFDDVLKQVEQKEGEECVNLIRGAWERDQQRNKEKKTGLRWCEITIRVCILVFTRSPAAYRALRDSNAMNLPSERHLQRLLHEQYVTNDENSFEKYLLQQSTVYDEVRNTAKYPGQRCGALIIDEVKVTGKAVMSIKSKKIIGLCSSIHDFSDLVDSFSTFDSQIPPRPAEFVVQSLWRDFTSEFELLGPRFFFAETIKAKNLMSIIRSTIISLHRYDWEVLALICDCARVNVKVMQLLILECSGNMGVGKFNPSPNPYELPVSFRHPADPSVEVIWLPCSVHVLKCAVSALHGSDENGKKSFRLGGLEEPIFGWYAVELVGEREQERRRRGIIRHVPHLKQSYIQRDSWTKMRVPAATAVVSQNMIAELKACERDETLSVVKKLSVKRSREYLEALHSMFIEGAISHQKIWSADSAPIQNMLKGLQFFVDWHSNLEAAKVAASKRRVSFVAPETFDSMRFLVFGWIKLTRLFFERFPNNYYLVPHRITGSPVESIFSIMRYHAGGNLTSLNYDPIFHRIQATRTEAKNLQILKRKTREQNEAAKNSAKTKKID